MEERYRKELNWWFAELTMDPEVQVERYLTIFPELKSRLSKFGVGILLWNMKGLVDINNPDDVSRVRLLLKVLDQTPCVPGTAFPHDRYGYSLIAVEVTPDNKIASITSRWNAYSGDSGNFITEDELKKILGDANYDKILCITT